MKLCSLCNETFPLDYFYRDKRNSTGYYSRCKACHQITIKQSKTGTSPRKQFVPMLKLIDRLTPDQMLIAKTVSNGRRALGLPSLTVVEWENILGLTPTK